MTKITVTGKNGKTYNRLVDQIDEIKATGNAFAMRFNTVHQYTRINGVWKYTRFSN